MLKLLYALPPFMTLSFAILFEIIATSMMPKTHSFTHPLATATVLGCYAVSFYLLSITVREMPLGIVYAIWSAAGIVLVSLIAWLWHGQQLDVPAIIGMLLVVAGVVVINLFSSVMH
ncbi:DMT family transporter [Enterovibrio nigricans]|uniref:Small multidrug resistance pump n=1 Tax=Enterovibrio nigricans DSM 22720 TaxID=1121868 RepID=A0A1T4VXJ9_9GAMM|nr:SMR family transporter [Enterovibrio nigricans]PKF48768.1 QacE family quaternary ammonium compound efflux SMR transporter [Enterovibrio nigricans]SKA69221.1 small multidrug resistance pump [Enterovibrio nigricans DSM 22720]